jgi:hypothetical protein
VADIRERFGKECLLLDLPAHGSGRMWSKCWHDRATPISIRSPTPIAS